MNIQNMSTPNQVSDNSSFPDEQTLSFPLLNWSIARLEDISEIVMGQSPPSETYNKEGFGLPFLQGKAEFTDLYPAPTVFCTRPQKVAKQGSILISVRAPVGATNIADQNYAIGRGLASLSLKKGDNRFLFYFLEHNKEKIKSQGSGTTFDSINRATLTNFPICYPSISEQRTIAHVLQTIQGAIYARRDEMVLERERKSALMDYLFTHGTRGETCKQTEIGEIPKSWGVVQLGRVAKIERGKFSHRPRNDSDFYGGDIPFIQTGDVTASNGYIRTYTQTLNAKGLSVSRVFPKGSIVITIAANIGYTGILEFDSAFPDSLIGITPISTINVDPSYLNYFLMTQQSEMDRKAPRGTQKNINIEFLFPWPTLIPPLEEQQEIAEVLTACDTKVDTLKQELDLLEELFHAVLEELMTGRLSTLPLIEERVEV